MHKNDLKHALRVCPHGRLPRALDAHVKVGGEECVRVGGEQHVGAEGWCSLTRPALHSPHKHGDQRGVVAQRRDHVVRVRVCAARASASASANVVIEVTGHAVPQEEAFADDAADGAPAQEGDAQLAARKRGREGSRAKYADAEEGGGGGEGEAERRHL